MSQPQCEFSEELSSLTADEYRWLKEQLELIYIYGQEVYPADSPLPLKLRFRKARFYGRRAYLGMIDYDPAISRHGDDFQHSFTHADSRLCIYTVNDGCPKCVGHLVQHFLKKFRPDDAWAMSYSATWPDYGRQAFGGGILFVTARTILLKDTAAFCQDQLRHFAQKQAMAHEKSENVATTDEAIKDQADQYLRRRVARVAQHLQRNGYKAAAIVTLVHKYVADAAYAATPVANDPVPLVNLVVRLLGLADAAVLLEQAVTNVSITWECPNCAWTTKVSYADLAARGGPICPTCDIDMDHIATMPVPN